jgi:hypothetical protein
VAKKGLIRGLRKLEILSKNLGICVYCNEAPAEQVDHILPRSWKINNDDNNLVGACADCNRIASDKVFSSFEEKQAYIVHELKKPKWKNRRVASYRYMPTVIEKLKPPQPYRKIDTKPEREFKKKEPFTEREVAFLKKKLDNVFRKLLVHGKVQAYEHIAAQLSSLAGLGDGHVWGWRYVASVHSGKLLPGRKFVQALDLYLEHFNARKKQWFYFARRRSVAAFYDKSILREMIFTHMQELGYKPITFSRYAELKRRKAA